CVFEDQLPRSDGGCRRARGCQGAAWKRRGMPVRAGRRPSLTAPARGGVRNLRSGRKKACGAVEQKKDRWYLLSRLNCARMALGRLNGWNESSCRCVCGGDFPLPVPARCRACGKRKRQRGFVQEVVRR